MYRLELIKFYVSNTSYYVEEEKCALLRDVVRSWNLGSHGKFLGKKYGNPAYLHLMKIRSVHIDEISLYDGPNPFCAFVACLMWFVLLIAAVLCHCA